MQIFVDINAANDGNGTQARPFKHIQEAADIAMPGDYISVLPGTYREEVHPRHSGTTDKPIIYSSAVQNAAIITGAERITDWQQISDHVWTVTIPNSRFGHYNPYTTLADHTFDHAGEVFLNNKAMYEVDSRAKVDSPVKNELSRDKSFTTYTWYTQQLTGKDATVIYANFQGKDPNSENVELTFRETCFSPVRPGVDNIVISSFSMTKAACQWASASYNKGLISTNCGAGWKITNCDVSHAKCSGISLGRYAKVPTGDLEAAKPLRHRLRNNTIHDCGQTGIIGVDGNPSPLIEHNSIFNINIRQNLVGEEVSAINLFPSIGAIIARNCIHDCTRGLWLGGKVARTRISRNVFYNNSLPHDFKITKANKQALLIGLGEDIHIQKSAGFTVIENNLLLSDRALKLESKGILLLHNLINGSTEWLSSNASAGSDAYYHRIYQPSSNADGDDSSYFFNNVFIRKSLRDEMKKLIAIAEEQTANATTADQFTADGNHFFAAQTANQHDRINHNKLGNVYLDDQLQNVDITIKTTGKGVFIDSNLDSLLAEDTGHAISMGKSANGATAFDTDFLGHQREGVRVTAGPFDHKHEYQQCLFKLFL